MNNFQERTALLRKQRDDNDALRRHFRGASNAPMPLWLRDGAGWALLAAFWFLTVVVSVEVGRRQERARLVLQAVSEAAR